MLWVKGIIAMAAHTHLAEHGSHINKHTTRPSTWHEFVTPKTRMISQISQAFRTIFQEGKAYFPFPTIKFISTSQPSPITFIYFLHWVHLRQVFVVWRQWHRSWKLEKTNTATFLVASIQWDFLVANVVLDISGKYSLSIVGIYSLLITCRPTWASCLLSSCCFWNAGRCRTEAWPTKDLGHDVIGMWSVTTRKWNSVNNVEPILSRLITVCGFSGVVFSSAAKRRHALFYRVRKERSNFARIHLQIHRIAWLCSSAGYPYHKPTQLEKRKSWGRRVGQRFLVWPLAWSDREAIG